MASKIYTMYYAHCQCDQEYFLWKRCIWNFKNKIILKLTFVFSLCVLQKLRTIKGKLTYLKNTGKGSTRAPALWRFNTYMVIELLLVKAQYFNICLSFFKVKKEMKVHVSLQYRGYYKYALSFDFWV